MNRVRVKKRVRGNEDEREDHPRSCKTRYADRPRIEEDVTKLVGYQASPDGSTRVGLAKSGFNGGDAGLGVYMMKSVKEGDFICFYFGNWKLGKWPGVTNVYVSEMRQTKIGHQNRSPGPWINDSRDQLYNCKFALTAGDELYVYATVDIDPGEELSLYYGEEFFGQQEGNEHLVVSLGEESSEEEESGDSDSDDGRSGREGREEDSGEDNGSYHGPDDSEEEGEET